MIKTFKKSLVLLSICAILALMFFSAFQPTQATPYKAYEVISPGGVAQGTYVFSAQVSTNYASNTTIQHNSNGGTRDALMTFDISRFYGNSTVSLYKVYFLTWSLSDTTPTDGLVNCYPVKSAWDVATVTWNTKPADNTTLLSKAAFSTSDYPTANKYRFYDVTDYIKESIATSTFYGFRLSSSDAEVLKTNPSASYLLFVYGSLNLAAPTGGVGFYYYNGSTIVFYTLPTGYGWFSNGTWVPAGNDYITPILDTGITTNNILLGIAVGLILICCVLGAKFAGGWGFLAGLTLGVGLVYTFGLIELWLVVLIGIVDAVALIRGMTGSGKKTDPVEG
jgi:hypothetical protein